MCTAAFYTQYPDEVYPYSGRMTRTLYNKNSRHINSSKTVWKSEFDRLFLPSLSNNRCMFDTIRKTIKFSLK